MFISTASNTTRTINCKPRNSPVEYPIRESKHDMKASEGNMFNPLFKENVQGGGGGGGGVQGGT